MFFNNLSAKIKADLPVVWIDSYDEDIVENSIKTLIKNDDDLLEYELYRWTCVDGLTQIDIHGIVPEEPNPGLSQFPMLFNVLSKEPEKKRIVILRIDQEVLNEYRFKRHLKNFTYKQTQTKLVFVSQYCSIPSDIEHLIFKEDMKPLSKELTYFFIESVYDRKQLELESKRKDKMKEMTKEDLAGLTNAALGLTSKEIQRGLSLSYEKHGYFKREEILQFKVDTVEKSGVLEYIEPTVTMDDIGGNNRFKDWIKEIKYTFTDKAKKFGVPEAKGHLALGIPGTSKTFSAEALAGELGLPLLKLSSDKIYSRYVGESEKNIRRAFEVAQSCAPCVLLIDEIEKTLSGVGSSNNSDAGTSSRVFATVLENLNEPNGVYTVMTSNDISQLPPELTRIGRIDALWYFSIPNIEERKEITKIHLKKVNIDLKDDLINYMTEKTDNFTGSEIEQVVSNLKRKAFVRLVENDLKELKIEKEDIDASIDEVSPIYEVSKEQIIMNETLMRGRVKDASYEEKEEENFNDGFNSGGTDFSKFMI